MGGKTARQSPVARRTFTAKRSAVADETDGAAGAAEAVGRQTRRDAGLHTREPAWRSTVARQAGRWPSTWRSTLDQQAGRQSSAR